MAYPKSYNPCDDCPYSFSKNNQESNMCKICEFKQLLDKPTADVVEVVRCGNCKNYNNHRYCQYFASAVFDDDFCSYGERKDSN